jgi:hypothetical protein
VIIKINDQQKKNHTLPFSDIIKYKKQKAQTSIANTRTSYIIINSPLPSTNRESAESSLLQPGP